MDMQGKSIPLWVTPVDGKRTSLADDMQILSRALLTRWKLILTIVVIALITGIGFLWQSAPIYRSTVDILVDPRARTIVGMDVVSAGLGSSSLGSDTGLVDSQVQILQSRSTLGAVIDKLGLANARPASTSPLAGVIGMVRAVLYGPNSADYASASPVDRALNELRSSLRIERVGNTYVLRVTVSSESSQAASDIANTLAAEYIAQGQAAINEATSETAAALEARLAELKSNSDTAQQALEDYRTANGLIDAQGVLVDEQQLRDLNDQVTRASVDTEMARARLAEVERLRGQPAAAIASSNTLTSTSADAIRLQLDTAVAEAQSLAGIYGPLHPTRVQAQQRIASLETALLQEFRRIEARASSDYETAQSSENALRALLTQSEARRAGSNQATIRLRELQTAADAARSIYDAFALRAAQTREQVDLPTNTSRIISAAEPASQPSEPRLPIVLGASAFLGLVVAFGAAWTLHLLRGTPVPPSAPMTGRRSTDRRAPNPRPPTYPAAAAGRQAMPAVAETLTAVKRRSLLGLFR